MRKPCSRHFDSLRDDERNRHTNVFESVESTPFESAEQQRQNSYGYSSCSFSCCRHFRCFRDDEWNRHTNVFESIESTPLESAEQQRQNSYGYSSCSFGCCRLRCFQDDERIRNTNPASDAVDEAELSTPSAKCRFCPSCEQRGFSFCGSCTPPKRPEVHFELIQA